MGRLFGTDGVRGKAGIYPLDHETVARLGAALVRAMRGESAPAGRPLRFIIGRDTRESGEMLEAPDLPELVTCVIVALPRKGIDWRVLARDDPFHDPLQIKVAAPAIRTNPRATITKLILCRANHARCGGARTA